MSDYRQSKAIIQADRALTAQSHSSTSSLTSLIRRHPYPADYIEEQYYATKRSDREIIALVDRLDPRLESRVKIDNATLIKQNCLIYGRAGVGVTSKLLNLARAASSTHQTVYLDLMERERGRSIEIEQQLYQSIEEELYNYLGEPDPTCPGGHLFIAIDQFDRVSPQIQAQARRFIDSILRSGCDNRVAVGSSSPVFLDNSFCSLEIAPWSSQMYSLSGINNYAIERLSNSFYSAEFIELIREMTTALGPSLYGRTKLGLAAIYTQYLRRILARLGTLLPLNAIELETLLSISIDSRTSALSFSEFEWQLMLDSVCRELGGDRTPPPEAISRAMFDAGIVRYFSTDKIVYNDPDFQLFLIARLYIRQKLGIEVFDREFLEDPTWHPIVIFYLELINDASGYAAGKIKEAIERMGLESIGLYRELDSFLPPEN